MALFSSRNQPRRRKAKRSGDEHGPAHSAFTSKGKPTQRAIFAARVNLSNASSKSFVKAWGKKRAAKIREHSRAILRLAGQKP